MCSLRLGDAAFEELPVSRRLATHFSASIAPPCLWAVVQFVRFRHFLPQLFQMTRKILTSLLLLLICGSVAAEPHKQRRTAAAPRAAKTQHNNPTPKEPSAEETSVKEPSAKEPPANELFGAAPVPLRLLLVRLAHTHEAALPWGGSTSNQWP